MIRDDHLWTPILGQGGEKQLEYGGEILMGRGHPGE